MAILQNPNEVETLQQLINEYAEASNASLNYHKIQAFSLSGKKMEHRITKLNTYGIGNWHDSNSEDPVIYLGYALCSSLQQRNNYAYKVINQTKELCSLHSSRNLTMKERMTVMNSLVYSKIWHTIRLFTFTKKQLIQLQQIAKSFINNNAKTTCFSFATSTLPVSKGGLKLLDPVFQSYSLQWRCCLEPLLNPCQTSPVHLTSLPYLKFVLDFLLSSELYLSYHWDLLFPSYRPHLTDIMSPITNLFQVIDEI